MWIKEARRTGIVERTKTPGYASLEAEEDEMRFFRGMLVIAAATSLVGSQFVLADENPAQKKEQDIVGPAEHGQITSGHSDNKQAADPPGQFTSEVGIVTRADHARTLIVAVQGDGKGNINFYETPSIQEKQRVAEVKGLPWEVVRKERGFYLVEIDGKKGWVNAMDVRTSPSSAVTCATPPAGAHAAGSKNAGTPRCK